MSDPSHPFLCLICGSPMPPAELNLDRSWHFTCQHCEYCKGEVTPEIVTKCLKVGSTVYHEPCFTQFFLNQLRLDLPKTQNHIRACNSRLLVKEWSCARPVDGDFEMLSTLLQDIQNFAKNIHQMLEQTKGKLLLSTVEGYREGKEKEKKVKAEIQASEIQDENQKLQDKARRDAERENPKLKYARKALEGTMQSLKMTESEARQFLGMPPASPDTTVQ